MSTLYDVLEADPAASPQKLRTAYRSALRRSHPDMPGGSTAAFLEVQSAWRILSDPAARARHDLRSTATTPPPAPSPTRGADEPLSDSWATAQHDDPPAAPTSADPRQRPVRSPDDLEDVAVSDAAPSPVLGGWTMGCPAWLLTPRRLGQVAAAGGGLSLTAVSTLAVLLGIGQASAGVIVLIGALILYAASAAAVRRASLPGETVAVSRLAIWRRWLYAGGVLLLALWLPAPAVLGPLVWGASLLAAVGGSHVAVNALIARRQLLSSS